MNIANKLTVSRIVMIPFFVAFLLVENVTADLRAIAAFRWAALLVFSAAAITDLLDGMLARRRGMITNFGRLMDPLADKLLTMAAFVAFVEIRAPGNQPVFPAWAIIVILGREFLVTGLRSLALEHGRVMHADRWGKHKTIWQLVGIIVVLVALCVRDLLRLFNLPFLKWFDLALPFLFAAILIIIVVLTVVSGIAYVVNNRDVISEDDGDRRVG
jgi:CDP-diacylglycerol--glycerol-3-phosphate 3-phosphatidyltransferase